MSANLDRIALALFDKLVDYRWPPPNPDQVIGLIYAHLEEAARERPTLTRSEPGPIDIDRLVRRVETLEAQVASLQVAAPRGIP